MRGEPEAAFSRHSSWAWGLMMLALILEVVGVIAIVKDPRLVVVDLTSYFFYLLISFFLVLVLFRKEEKKKESGEMIVVGCVCMFVCLFVWIDPLFVFVVFFLLLFFFLFFV